MNSAFPPRPRRRSPSPCSPTRRSTRAPATFPARLARNAPPSSDKLPMRNLACYVLLVFAFSSALFVTVSGCKRPQHATDTVTFLIESSPANLDPRIGTDAQSQRIDMLMFDSLVHRGPQFNIQPWIAKSWDRPDAQTY